MEMNLTIYREIISNLPETVELRHDVDFSVEAALEVAKIDHRLGVKSSFYIRPHAYYLEWEFIRALHSMKHRVGIHLNTPATTNPDVLTQMLQNAYLNISKFGHVHKAFTFHRNDEVSASFTQPQYYGFLNHNLCPDGYVSDARGIMPEIPKKGVLNLHPEWWVYPGKTPKEKIEYYFNQKIEQCLKEILPD